MKKRLLSILVALSTAIAMLPPVVWAEGSESTLAPNYDPQSDEVVAAGAVIDSGTFGVSSNLGWRIESGSSGNTLIIDGVGAMYQYGSRVGPWNDYGNSISKIIVEEGVTNIAPAIFRECAATSIFLSSTVGDLNGYMSSTGYWYDNNLFDDCEKLQTISVAPDNPAFTSVDGVLFDKYMTRLISYPRGRVNSMYEIPDGIMTIGEFAFSQCDNLSNVIIPDSVAEIKPSAFYLCYGLTSINLPDSVTSLGNDAFSNCIKATNLKISKGLSVLESNVFVNCNSLTSVEIPNSVTTITSTAISGTNLTSIYIPSSVMFVETGAFRAGCDNLKDIYYGGSKEQWMAIQAAPNNNFTSLANYTTEDGQYYRVKGTTEQLAEIHYNSSEPNNPGTETKTISGVLRHGDGWEILWKCNYQLDENNEPCNGNAQIYMEGLSDQVEELYTYNEASTDGFPWELVPYNIPKSAIIKLSIQGQTVGKTLRITANAFQNYNNLETVLLNDVSGIDSYAFEGCTSLKEILISDDDHDLIRIGNGAFKNCTSLSGVTFTPGITDIGDEAFENTSLGTITLGRDVTNIGENAFSSCPNVKIRCYENSVAHQYAQDNDIPYELIPMLTDNTFILGQDQWSFGNWPEYFTDGKKDEKGNYIEKHFLNDEDYDRLVQTLSNTAKEQLDSVISEKSWGGSCYGMSSIAVLTKIGVINPNNIQAGKGSLYSITKTNNDDVESFISFYQFHQDIIQLNDYFNRFVLKNTIEQLQIIEEKAENVTKGGIPMVLLLDDGDGGHAVVAYGVEHGEFYDGFLGTSLGGTKYDSRILIYDCNNPEGSEQYHLLYNSGTDQWSIPHYSTKYNKLIALLDDPVVLDCVNYGIAESNRAARLDFNGNAVGYYFDWAGSRIFIDGSTDKREDGLITYHDSDGVGSSGTLHLTLPSLTDSYSVVPIEGESGNFTIFYEDSSLSMTCDGAEKITFSPAGQVTATGISGQYSADLVFNEGHYSLPWYKTSISGADCGNLSLEQISEGIIIAGDNLENVVAKVKNDEEIRTLQFSTDQEAALLTSEIFDDAQKPIIKLDSDGDGVYDEVVETYTIAFDANGGSVTPASMDIGSNTTPANLPVPIRDGYTFNGWYLADGTKVDINTVFNTDTTIKAQWTQNNTAGNTPSNPGSSTDQPSGTTPNHGGSSYNPGGYVTPTYSITVPFVTGGKISVSPASASSGSTVMITTTPDSGYELTSLTVSDASGKLLELTSKGYGKYSFKMPNSKVTLNVEFQSINSVIPWSNPFSDVADGDWYYDAVKFVNENGIMTGIGNGLFAPNANLSRAMFAQILYNKDGKPDASRNVVFSDVPSEAWYSDAVTWAAQNGFVTGYGDGVFGPDDAITREQMAVILWRYAGQPAASSLLPQFTDIDKISGYAREALYWAIEQGVINGKNNNTLDPKGFATRAEVAQMLKNYLEK